MKRVYAIREVKYKAWDKSSESNTFKSRQSPVYAYLINRREALHEWPNAKRCKQKARSGYMYVIGKVRYLS